MDVQIESRPIDTGQAGRSEFRVESAFGALVLVQAAHSTEEYIGRLWESLFVALYLATLQRRRKRNHAHHECI